MDPTSAFVRLRRLVTTRPSLKAQRIIIWGLLILTGIECLHWIQQGRDFRNYRMLGELVLSGKHIYRDAIAASTWPPFFSLWCVPLALLGRISPYLARGLWLILNLLLVGAILKMLVRLVYGTDLKFHPSRTGLTLASPEVLWPLLLSGRFILSNFEYLQVNIVIFALTLAGLYWQSRGRDVLGGSVIGFAAALKVMPALFIPYLFYRRRIRAGLAATLTLVACTLSPVLVFGWGRTAEFLKDWPRAAPLGWGAHSLNQSIYAMLDRFIGHGITPFNATKATEAFIPFSGEPAVLIMTGALIALIVVAGMWLFRGRQSPGSLITLAEVSAIFIASALFSPLTWKAYLVVLMCPCLLLVGLIRRRILRAADRRGVIAALAVYFLLAGFTPSGLVGSKIAGILQSLSVVTIAALILLLTLFWVRQRLEKESQSGGTR